MPGYIALIICIYILAATGALKEPCMAIGINVLTVCYIMLCTLALSVFQLRIGVELNINLGAAVLALLPGMLMSKEDEGSGIGAVVLISTIIALLQQHGGMYGTESGLMCGLVAGTSAMVLWESRISAICAAGGIPIIASAICALFSLIHTGYTAIEITYDTIAAQLIALCISTAIIWIRTLAAKSADVK